MRCVPVLGRSARKQRTSMFMNKSKSALSVLDHKLKNVRVTRHFSNDCGRVRGYPSELAQV